MKKLLPMLAIAAGLFMASCEETGNGNGDGDTVIKLEEGTSPDQTIAAAGDEVSVSFTATGDWSSYIIETAPNETRANISKPLPAVGWATVEGSSGTAGQMTGTAGEHTIKITFVPNDKTTARAIQLRILSGDSYEAIRITQPGGQGGGDIEPKQVASIRQSESVDGVASYTSVTDFTYNPDGSVASILKYDPEIDGTSKSYVFAYEPGKIVLSVSHSYSGFGTEYTLVLDGDGYVTKITLEGGYEDEMTFGYEDGYLRTSSSHGFDYHYSWRGGNRVKSWEGDTEPEDNEYGSELYFYTNYLNSTTNIDLNMMFISPISPVWEDDIAKFIGYAGLMGKRSANLTTSYFIYMSASSDPYIYHKSKLEPLVYTFDGNGYVTKITAVYLIERYVDDKLESTRNYTETYEITYTEQ